MPQLKPAADPAVPDGAGRARSEVAGTPSLSARLFPGERRIWRWSLVALVPLLVAIGWALLEPRGYYVGTNSVGVRSVTATLPAHQKLCVPGISIPSGTGAVQIAIATPTRVQPLAVSIQEAGQVVARGKLDAVPPLAGVTDVSVPVTPTVTGRSEAGFGTVCITAGTGGPVAFGGFAGGSATTQPPNIGGRAIGGDVALWFLPPGGRQRSLVENWPSMMRRLGLFRPGFAGAWFYWALFLLVLPLVSYGALRLLATAGKRGGRPALWLALLAFVNAGAWAATTIPFDAPDESEHYAYTESVAEAGRAPDASPSARSPYATDEGLALAAIHHFATIEIGDTRPPWFARDELGYQSKVDTTHPGRDNGGGFTLATEVHSPLYYSLLLPGYALGRSGGVFDELFWMRVVSALLATIVVLAAFGTVRELAPGRPELAVGAALLVAFQPMFSFMSGVVNNDVGVNAMAALTIYLTIRALRRGLSWRLALALGAAAALTPIMKGTGLAILPAVAVALLAKLIVDRSRATLLGVASAVGSFAAVGALWGLVAGAFHRSASGTASGASVASGQLTGKLTYVWEVFLPRLPFMAAHWPEGMWPFMFIYVRRGFAAFGWYAIFFPSWVYKLIVVAMAVLGLLSLLLLVRRRAELRARWIEPLFLLLVILGVVGGVHAAYYTPTPRPPNLTPEQGRYAFTAIVPLAVLALGGLLVLPRRWGTALLAVVVTGMIGLSMASHLLYVTHNFT